MPLKIITMHKFPLLFLFVLVGFSGIQISCNPISMETISDIESTYDGITKVNVNGGALEISYTGRDEAEEVVLNAFVEASDSQMEGVTVKKIGEELFVDFEPRDDFGSFFSSFKVKGFISITGPSDMALNINNSSGTMEVFNVDNEDIVLKGSSGKIEAENLRSPNLSVRISSGKLELENIQGDLNLELSSGMGTLEGMKGNVKFRGSSGMVVLTDIDGLVSGSMSSGKADLNEITELGEISLTSGMLVANDCGLGPETNLSASSGYMKVNTRSSLKDYNYDFKVGSGRLSIGDQSSSYDLLIDNAAEVTIKGKIQSGKMVIED